MRWTMPWFAGCMGALGLWFAGAAGIGSLDSGPDVGTSSSRAGGRAIAGPEGPMAPGARAAQRPEGRPVRSAPTAPTAAPEAGDGAPDARGPRGVAQLMRLDAIELREVAAWSDDPGEAQAAVWAMANRLALDEDDVYALLDRMRRASSGDDELLQTIVWALSLRPDRVPVPEIAALAVRHPAPGVRRTAVRTLSTVSGEAALRATLEAALHDPESRNRAEAVTLLVHRLRPDEARGLAGDALAREPDEGVRARWRNLLETLIPSR